MRLMKRALMVVATMAVLVMMAAPAFAHVTVRVDNPEAGAFAKYTVRAPNESDEASTVSIEVQLPPGFEEARYQPAQGWDIEVRGGVLNIEGGELGPGQFQEFYFSAQNPEEPTELVFPVVQTYDDGEVSRWVGEPDSDAPASVITIVPSAGEGHGAGATATEDPNDATEPSVTGPPIAASEGADENFAAAATSSTSDSQASPLSIIALITGVLGLILGGVAFARTRNSAAR